MKELTTREKLPPVIKVAVVDDHDLFRAGVVALLKDHEGLKVVIQASNGVELMDQLHNFTPHVILLDIEMPGLNGLETIKIVKNIFPSIRIIIQTMHFEDGFISEMISRGAHGFIPKDKTVDEVVNAIYSVMETGKYYNEQVGDALANNAREPVRGGGQSPHVLTEKETVVLKLICLQKTDREIADILGINRRAVETIRISLLSKTGAKNTAGIIAFAVNHKLIPGI